MVDRYGAWIILRLWKRYMREAATISGRGLVDEKLPLARGASLV